MSAMLARGGVFSGHGIAAALSWVKAQEPAELRARDDVRDLAP